MVYTVEELSILNRLWRNRCFGKGHMLIDNLIGGFPTNVQPHIRHILKDLIRRGHIVKKPTRHGYAVYINPNFKMNIMKELRKKYVFVEF